MTPRMRPMAAALAALMLLTASGTPAANAAGKRLRFPAGHASAVVSGVGGGDYVFRAKAGQKLVVILTAPAATVFSLTSPKGTNMAGEGGNGRAEFQLEETGDYHLSVFNRDSKRPRYRLSVSIL
ncbi:MAG: hypothetical protein JOZ96_28485 [Acidobacteria bacterium]|nr:hypothetical protein [Acidobacteriota bacterium]